jgi:(p)ppGpp synthase/HD superfamily hydrolase
MYPNIWDLGVPEERQLMRAIQIAFMCHTGQEDKAEVPYLYHCLRVGGRGRTKDETILGILHDVVEDGGITIHEFGEWYGEFFSNTILDALEAITRKDTETYEEYIERVMSNPLATRVKIHDLEHNLEEDRIPNPTKKDRDRWNKYKSALYNLQEHVKDKYGKGK